MCKISAYLILISISLIYKTKFRLINSSYVQNFVFYVIKVVELIFFFFYKKKITNSFCRLQKQQKKRKEKEK